MVYEVEQDLYCAKEKNYQTCTHGELVMHIHYSHLQIINRIFPYLWPLAGVIVYPVIKNQFLVSNNELRLSVKQLAHIPSAARYATVHMPKLSWTTLYNLFRNSTWLSVVFQQKNVKKHIGDLESLTITRTAKNQLKRKGKNANQSTISPVHKFFP